MSSDVDICNLALGHVGQERFISSLSDTSVEAGRCARFYPIVRRAVFARYVFQFTKRRVLLSLAVSNPSSQWLFAYNVPADCINPLFINDIPYDLNAPERCGAIFNGEGTLFLTNIENAEMVYVRDVTDATQFPADLVTSMSMLLAGYLAGPTLKGAAGAQIGGALIKQGWDAVSDAAANDANGAREDNAVVADHLAARA